MHSLKIYIFSFLQCNNLIKSSCSAFISSNSNMVCSVSAAIVWSTRGNLKRAKLMMDTLKNPKVVFIHADVKKSAVSSLLKISSIERIIRIYSTVTGTLFWHSCHIRCCSFPGVVCLLKVNKSECRSWWLVFALLYLDKTEPFPPTNKSNGKYR